MAKVKKAFFCQNCGSQHTQWQGQCNTCKEWNTLVEEIIEKEAPKEWASESTKEITSPIRMDAIDVAEVPRIKTQDEELNRVLGGGLVPGSVILLGGEPGIGKSTLLLQVSLSLNSTVLYVSGEESQQQIKLRADRMELDGKKCFVLSQTETQKIFQQIQKVKPDLVIVDSIQTLHSNYIESGAGSVSQIRATAGELIQFAKSTNTPVILVGHITKDGNIAGPKILEHMVDTVLQFEGDRNHLYRILRAQKNRFGATSEIGIYEMISQGLRQVTNPSEVLISEKEDALSGHAIAATVEGIRPLMIEVQALVSTAVYGTPQRSSTGFNAKRLNMLLAVLEKRAGFALGSKDVFINITGGINIEDPALDMAVVAALLSSYHDIPIAQNICFAAEIGLSGEIRPVAKAEIRIQEAEKIGYENIAISKFSKLGVTPKSIQIHAFSKVENLVEFLF
ncbi:MAG: DNA repair protein RadA [Flavobacteriaceae bacterium]|jgi:DNA repair protein RadA/Sms|nr:DNA repair protein RadA [Flavobacteriaceae bacterium]MBT5446055.1 DNA repair protein RadA [Flavobacteriaceae bacterium]MBT5693718.1 DNA repair protein RadA [Flavobacteriaceae bacterium]MBT5974947.1 DNA repair protein RadA [Flavobacteriaceae bacterium]MDA7698603.1 DNA repair protein RadA [Flavobacteriaceae bacterium]|tara:strand:- start:575 stop:1927 length:1353 start_codon:yes stop_codon:yes gene_type:complete